MLSCCVFRRVQQVFQVVLAQKHPKWLYHLCMRRFKRVGQDGPLTRLMACTKEELEAYTPLDVVDTYIAPSFAKDSAHSDDYPPYNKPGAVTHWLRVSSLRALTLPGSLAPLAACSCSVRHHLAPCRAQHVVGEPATMV